MATLRYKIRLKPQDWYFFGGETTFGEGYAKSYFAKSNPMPQQTSLLGMLRFQLLQNQGLLPIGAHDIEDVNRLIGSRSFDFQSKGETAFGAIKSISPIYIEHEDELYTLARKNEGQAITIDESVVAVNFGEHQGQLPTDCSFSQKKYYQQEETWVSKSGKRIASSNIFCTRTRIGITKTSSNRADDNKEGFFKTISYNLKAGYAFVFFATLNESVEIAGVVKKTELKSAIVNLGAERSMFSMEVVESLPAQDGEPIFEPLAESQLLFLSDAFVDPTFLKLCKFAWIDTIPFRNIIRTTRTKNYVRLDRKGERSAAYNLVRRGGVVYFDPVNLEAIQQYINKPYLQSVGYNIYQIGSASYGY